MKKYGTNAAAFDVPEYLKEAMDKVVEEINSQNGRAKGFSIEIATSLVDLEDLEENVTTHREDRGGDRDPSPDLDERIKREAYKRKK
jgi:hypothetical protein